MKPIRPLIPLLLLAVTVAAVAGARHVRERDEHRREEGHMTARWALDRRTAELKYEQVPFDRVIDDLRTAAGLPIEVDWDALRARGFDPAQPITARLYNVRGGKSLQIVLDAASSPAVKLGYEVTDRGTLRIIHDRQPGLAALDFYDIEDLLPDIPADPGPTVTNNLKSRADLIGDITDLITQTVAPDSWCNANGTTGSIHYTAGRLVVVQTLENHRQIAGLLRQLRESHPPAGRELRRLRGRAGGWPNDD